MIKRLNKILGAITLFTGIALGSNGVFAQDIYPVMGHIDTINEAELRVNDMMYRMSPTVKVVLKNKSPGTINDLKKKSFIGATTITINRRQLIDTIYVLEGFE